MFNCWVQPKTRLWACLHQAGAEVVLDAGVTAVACVTSSLCPERELDLGLAMYCLLCLVRRWYGVLQCIVIT